MYRTYQYGALKWKEVKHQRLPSSVRSMPLHPLAMVRSQLICINFARASNIAVMGAKRTLGFDGEPRNWQLGCSELVCHPFD